MQTRITIAPIVFALLTVTSCSRTVKVESGGDVSNDVIPSTASVLPVGTTLEVKTDQKIDAEDTRVGDRFTAHVTKAVMAQDGAVVVPEGAIVEGRVTGIETSQNPTRPALIRLEFQSLRIGDRTYPFSANIERTAIPGRDSDLKKKVVIGGAVGAALGAVIGRDVKDLVIGGVIGAAAGSLISLGMDRADARLPAGTGMTIRNERRVALR
jgi:uncharacterized membrane protein